MFIVGNDISSFQGSIDWATYKQNTNFVIIKMSEGTGFIDPEAGNNRQQARNYDLPRGFYHFAHPDLGNTPEDEAKYFCDLIDGDPIQVGEVLALDFEVNYNDPVTWCKTWLDTVSAHYNGLKPLIYLNQSIVQSYDWSPVVNAGYGLWIAAYTNDPTNNVFQTGKWSYAAIQQWSDNQTVPGIPTVADGDVFFGTSAQFLAYGYRAVIPQPTPQPVSTPVVSAPNDTPTPPTSVTTTPQPDANNTTSTSDTSTFQPVVSYESPSTEPVVVPPSAGSVDGVTTNTIVVDPTTQTPVNIPASSIPQPSSMPKAAGTTGTLTTPPSIPKQTIFSIILAWFEKIFA